MGIADDFGRRYMDHAGLNVDPLKGLELHHVNWSKFGAGQVEYWVHSVPEGQHNFDLDFAREVEQYADLDYAGQTVLDLGANIGTFTIFADALGAESIVAVEPVPDNLRVLGLNVGAMPNVKVVSAAAVSQAKGAVPMYRNPNSSRSGSYSLTQFRGRQAVCQVTTVGLSELYSMADFTTIKIDIEGGEYGLLLTGVPLPDSVKQIAVELHLLGGARDEAQRVVDLLGDWEMLREPDLTKTFTTGAWRRE